MQYLEQQAGIDSAMDNYHRGVLAGLNEVLNIRADDLTEEDSHDS